MNNSDAVTIGFFETISSNKVFQAAPKWLRSLGRDSNGVLYVPASILSRNEYEVMLMASFDGVPTSEYLNHLFVPMDWVQKESKNKDLPGTFDKMRESMAKVK